MRVTVVLLTERAECVKDTVVTSENTCGVTAIVVVLNSELGVVRLF